MLWLSLDAEANRGADRAEGRLIAQLPRQEGGSVETGREKM